jgi:farnesyl-diphosphate farnesyltransferase
MGTVDAELRWCRDALPGVSRTFALGISLLREPLRDEVGVAYLVCRVLDTLEDTTGLPPAERAAALEQCAASLPDPDAGRDAALRVEALFARPGLAGRDHALCRQAGVVMRAWHGLRAGARQGMAPHVREMALGMAATVRREAGGPGLRLEDEQDLKRYCYYVAGTVGKLLCHAWEHDRPDAFTPPVMGRLRERAVNFGLGLQVTNIIKGVTDDIERGVAYVPRKLFDAAGIDLESLLANPADPRGRNVVAGLAGMTLAWLDDALEYTLAIPGSERDIRLFCALPLLIALRTLARALRTTDVFSERVLKISREEVRAIHAETEAAIGDAAALRRIHGRERERVEQAIAAACQGAS